MGDHSETVQVEFNPQEITYAKLLDFFWASHNPRHNGSRRQYRNAIFTLDDVPLRVAEQSRQQLAATLGAAVKTDIESVGEFFAAEDYHQKYYLRRSDQLLAEVQSIYPDDNQFVASTAAARLNGYLGCNGQPEDLEREIGQLGLSVPTQQWLIKHLSTSCSGFQGVTCPAPQ